MTKELLRDRLLLILCAVLFIGLFNYVYITIVTKRWAYLGFTFESPPIKSMVLVLLLCLLPIFWMPIRLTRPSQVIYWLLYAIVYVPSLFLPHFMQRQSTQDLYLLNISFFFSFCITGLTYKFPFLPVAHPKCSKNLWWFLIFFIAVLLYAAVLAVYGGRLQFSGLYNTELRLAAREIDTTFLTGYGQVWLANVINPIFMAVGLFRKKQLLFLIGVAGQILLFMTAADKMFILSIVFLPLLFILLRSKTNIFGLRFLLGMSLTLLLTILSGFYESIFSTIIQDQLSLRFFSNAGFLTSVYSDFFSQNPWTYWSYIKGVNLFIQYPYNLPVGFLIGDYLGDVTNHASAHAWATDGISSMGLSGVLIAGLIIGVIFYMLDISAIALDPRFSGLSIAMQGIVISNTSIISTCLGGGLLFNMFLFWLMPRCTMSIRYVVPELKNKKLYTCRVRKRGMTLLILRP